MLLERRGQPLKLANLPIGEPGENQLLVRVRACGVCRTDLHVVDGDLENPKLPLVPGHQIVGVVERVGLGDGVFRVGDRIGIPWLASSCGKCHYCAAEQENLCDEARYTGYQVDGGFAEYCIADGRFCFPIPADISDSAAAPLLCAGLIGYRALRMTGAARELGFYGFGAAAHLLIQVARYQGRNVYAFTRSGDQASQRFALDLGACWAGPSEQPPPLPLDAAIIFAPAGSLVPLSLRAVRKGGSVICAGIHMSDIPSFPYEALWGERILRSVANLTRKDGEEFLKVASDIRIHTTSTPYALEETNQALADLRSGAIQGAAVVCVS